MPTLTVSYSHFTSIIPHPIPNSSSPSMVETCIDISGEILLECGLIEARERLLSSKQLLWSETKRNLLGSHVVIIEKCDKLVQNVR